VTIAGLNAGRQAIRRAAKLYGLRVADITGPSRRAVVVRARDLAAWLARDVGGLSYPELGHVFGGRHHTTMMVAVKRGRQMER
jgi:chromosomal replication initiator protein